MLPLVHVSFTDPFGPNTSPLKRVTSTILPVLDSVFSFFLTQHRRRCGTEGEVTLETLGGRGTAEGQVKMLEPTGRPAAGRWLWTERGG